jgi:DNA invertase Pin-like site-specific DNA recombinase
MRAELLKAIDAAKSGDEFVVTSLDRVARSASDLMGLLLKLHRKNVAFRSLDADCVTTAQPESKLVLEVVTALASFEQQVRREARLEREQRQASRQASPAVE